MCSNYIFPGKCVPMIEKPSTKKILADSMLELSRTVTINKITVDMIVKNCGYSRKTFYNHFLDKYDLAYWIFETNSNRIIAQYSENCTWGEILGNIYRFMYENGNLFGVSWDPKDLKLATDRVINYCDEYYRRRLIALHGDQALNDEIQFLLKFNNYGASHMVMDWVNRKWKQTPEELGLFIADAMPARLAELLEL